jgi:phosphoglycerate kinase
MIQLRKLEDADLKEKKVLLRADLDVPLEDSKITDATRLEAWFPTLEYLTIDSKEVVIAGHLGRPDQESRQEFSLEPIALWVAQKLGSEPQESRFGEFNGWKINDQISILENLRFFKEEEINDREFAMKLAGLADLYVNDAFAASHRSHASIVGVSSIIPSYAGLRLQKEVEELSKVLESPKRPLTIIIGGAKIETKLPLISKMHQVADYVLVGGEIAEHVRELAKIEHQKVENKKSELLVADLTPDNEDIDEPSIQSFKEAIAKSKTLIWNGPMGEFEKCFDLGTREIANSIVQSSAHTIVGGGDTLAFLNKEELINKFSFVSMGGGAMLEFLAGDELPGIEVLKA